MKKIIFLIILALFVALPVYALTPKPPMPMAGMGEKILKIP